MLRKVLETDRFADFTANKAYREHSQKTVMAICSQIAKIVYATVKGYFADGARRLVACNLHHALFQAQE